MNSQTSPRFFRTSAAFREWLEKNHVRAAELWVGFYKKGSGRGGLTYPEAVDEALCFGWIDGVRKSFDAESYMNRFTPRRKGSIWSAANVKRFAELTDAQRMHPAGLKVFNERDPDKTNRYSFERETVQFSPAQLARFKKNRKAWQFFESQPPSYRKVATWWVVSAKQPATQDRRLAKLIGHSSAGARIA